MGLTLVEKLNRIFNTPSNFDISGFCNPELVTEDLAKELMKAYSTPGYWGKLAKAGYDLLAFDKDGTSGIIGSWKNRRRAGQEHLKLYWDQYFPAEIKKMKRGETNEQPDQL